jgi:hypothetical protein
MDFLDPEKKRKHNRQLYIGYGLMAVLILTASVLLLLFAFGFSFDRRTGNLVQNGLVFVNTSPVTADVYLNGELRGRGDQRLVLTAGAYEIEVREEGYRTWRHDINLSGGQLVRFAYPFLFAEDITTSTYRTFGDAPRLLTSSPDRRWLLLQETEQVDAFVLYDLNRQVNLPSFFTLPPGVMRSTDSTSQLEIVEWSNDNRHVVLKHRIADVGTDFILLDREDPNASQNLTMRFADITFSDVSLIDKRFDSYHLFNRATGTVYQAQLDVDRVEPLLEDVITYRSHGSDILLYITPEVDQPQNGAADVAIDQATGSFVVVNIIQGGDTYELVRLPADGDDAVYYLDLARFRGAWYVVAASSANNQALVYENPIDYVRRNGSAESPLPLIPLAVLRADAAIDQVKFSANARNIMVQAAERFLVYDIERDGSHEFELGDGTELATWMDGHRITSSSGNIFRVVDFDGRNEHELQPCRADSPGLFDRNYEHLYCIAPTEQGEHGALIRAALRTPEVD